jgi:hypothetical protein
LLDGGANGDAQQPVVLQDVETRAAAVCGRMVPPPVDTVSRNF